jgi:hypothetical protein
VEDVLKICNTEFITFLKSSKLENNERKLCEDDFIGESIPTYYPAFL